MRTAPLPDFHQILMDGNPDRVEFVFAHILETPVRLTPDMLLSMYLFKIAFRTHSRHWLAKQFLQSIQGIQADPLPDAPETRYGCVFYRKEERVLEVYTSRAEDRGILRTPGAGVQGVARIALLHQWLRSYEKRIVG